MFCLSFCSPFFGEEFQFEVPRKFRYLSVYVYDRDKPNRNDRMLGKVAIKREDLQAFHNKDHWFPIRPITLDSEVQVSFSIGRCVFGGLVKVSRVFGVVADGISNKNTIDFQVSAANTQVEGQLVKFHYDVIRRAVNLRTYCTYPFMFLVPGMMLISRFDREEGKECS